MDSTASHDWRGARCAQHPGHPVDPSLTSPLTRTINRGRVSIPRRAAKT